MPKFKLSTIKKLFPEEAVKLEDKDKEINFGKMFKVGEEEKKRVVEDIIAYVDENKRQRAGLMEIKAESVRNYEGIEKQRGPWKGSSNISTMITTIAADMMHSKLWPMIWNPESLHFIGTEENDDETAKNNEVLMRWAVTKDMEDSQDKTDDMIHRLVVDGTLAVKIVWEIYYTYVTRKIPLSVNAKGEIKFELVYDRIRRQRAKWIVKDIDYVYFNFNADSAQCTDVVEEVYYTLPDLREMKAKGFFLPDVDIDTLANAVEKTFDPEGTIKARYESSGIETYYARRDSYPIKCYEAYKNHAFKDDTIRKQCIFFILPNEKIYMSGKPLHVVSRIGKKPWIIKPFLRRPGLLWGKGVPELVRHLHREMNAIHNQRIDAGNMVIAPFFFYRAASGMKPERLNIRPATGIPLDDVRNDVFFPDYNAGRLSVSFKEEAVVMDLIEKLTFQTPAMLGRETASRPTARGTLAVIAQGEQRFIPLAARVQRIFNEIITQTRQYYEENLPEGTQKRVLGKKGNPVWGRLSPEMIAGQYDAHMTLDLSAGDISFDKQADQLIFQTLGQDPFVNQNPAYAWEIRANYLLALGKKSVEKIIGPKPDVELNEGDMEDENLLMSEENEVPVRQDEDHLGHMNSHQQFKREHGGELTPNALRILTMHTLEHREMHAGKLQELALVQQQGGQNGGQGGEAGAAGTPSAPGVGTIQGPPVGE